MEFATKDQLFRYLKDNKDLLIAEKKSAMKRADAVVSVSECGETVNKSVGEQERLDKMTVKVVINTTNLMDSHGDVHIPGLWNKSIKDRTKALFLQEHQMQFDKVISDSAVPSVKSMSWASLGQSFAGQTQALIFDVEMSEDRNPFMFNQYRKGYVSNHSVGMQYVKLALAVNSNDKYYREEKDTWDKYISQVVNDDYAKEKGYFWAVTEAKMVEGSAVLMGSNYATPTLSIKNDEPSADTHEDKAADTVTVTDFQTIFHNQLTKTFKQ